MKTAKTALLSGQMLEMTAVTETTEISDQMVMTEQNGGAEGVD